MKQIREINLSSVLVNLHQNGPLLGGVVQVVVELEGLVVGDGRVGVLL